MKYSSERFEKYKIITKYKSELELWNFLVNITIEFSMARNYDVNFVGKQ